MPELAEPPPAPAAAPSAPPPAPSEDRDPSSWLGDTANDFSEMDAGRPAPSRDDKGKFLPVDKKPEAKVPQPAKTALEDLGDGKGMREVEVKPPDNPTEKPTEQPSAEVKPVKAAELRVAYDALKKRVKVEYEPQLQSLKAKVQELESRKPEDSAPVLQKLKAAEEEVQRMRQHIGYLDYTKQPEYTAVQQKYADGWNDALSEFNELTVRERAGEDEVGEPKFTVRPATDKDLMKLANMSLSDMDAAATEMFGASAARAIGHLQNIRRLSSEKYKAEREAEKKSGEWNSQRQMQQQQHSKLLADTWGDVNKTLQEKFPKAFKVDEGDADDAASHTKGFALADLMFVGPSGLTPEQVEALPEDFKAAVKSGKPLNPVQTVRLHALARLKMANHDRQVAKGKKKDARIAELEKTLADYEKSEPPAGKGGEGTAVGSKDWETEVADELKALDR